MRGTVSALTADADEFGTMRALHGAARSARGWRRPGAGAKILIGMVGTGAVDRAAGDHGFRGRNTPARPVRLDSFGFLTAGGEPSTVTVRVQFSDRSFDRATKRRPHFNSESHNIARSYCKLFASIAKTVAVDRMRSPVLHPLFDHSQFKAPPVWYSITRVSKKFRSFFRSIISLIHGNGLSTVSNNGSMPICWQRRFAM
jgi:hypothetical protein